MFWGQCQQAAALWHTCWPPQRGFVLLPSLGPALPSSWQRGALGVLREGAGASPLISTLMCSWERSKGVWKFSFTQTWEFGKRKSLASAHPLSRERAGLIRFASPVASAKSSLFKPFLFFSLGWRCWKRGNLNGDNKSSLFSHFGKILKIEVPVYFLL